MKFYIIFLLTFVCSLYSQSEQQIEKDNQYIYELLRQEKYKEALPFAEKNYTTAKKKLKPQHFYIIISMNNLATTYDGIGKYKEAEQIYKECLETNEKVFGEDHLYTIISMNNLALSCYKSGKYKKSEDLYNKCLVLCKKTLKEEDEQILGVLNNLALLYNKQGKYSSAENLYNECIKRSQKFLGNEHPSTINSMHNLAAVYKSQGRYVKAENLYKKCILLGKKVLGDIHPRTLSSIHNLSGVYEKQGKYKQAESLYQQCLDLRKKVLGHNHPNTLTSIVSLAILYEKQGKHEQAESLHQKCLDLRTKLFGHDHPDTLTSMNNLAVVFEKQGKYEQAESLYRRSLDLRTKLLGEEHPDTLTLISNLSLLYSNQGKYKQAESLQQKNLDLRTKLLGSEHPDTLISLNNLAAIYTNQGKYEQAQSLYKKCLDLRTKLLGKEHPNTLTSMSNLALSYVKQGKYNKAEPLYQESLEIYEKVLPNQYFNIIFSTNNLAALFEKQGKYKEAESFYKKCLNLQYKANRKKHPHTLTYMNNLAGVYFIQKKYKEAQSLYKECLTLRQEVLGKEHPDTLTSLNNLAFIYKTKKEYDLSKSFYEECLALRQKVLGKEHSDTLISLNNLATLYFHKHEYNKSILLHQECLELRQKFLGQEHPDTISSMEHLINLYSLTNKLTLAQKFSFERLKNSSSYLQSLLQGSNKNVQKYFLSQQRNANNLYLSLNFQLNSIDKLVYFSLTHKGLLFSMSSKVRSLNIQRESSEIQNMFHEWNENQRSLSHLLLNPPKKLQSSTLIQRQKELKETIDKLERKLGLLSSRFKNKFTKIKLQDIQNNLNKKEVVIDFLIFDKMNLDSLQYTEKYMIASIIQQNKILLVPIGSFTNIEKALNEYRETMSNKTKSSYSKKLSQKLYNLIWQPLSPHLKNVKNITIVPDAELHMLPFASLCDEDGKYLIEKIHLETCSSLRQIALDRETITNKGEVVLFSNPNYDNSMDQRETLGLSFSKLPGTAKESKNIAKILASKNLSYKSYELDQATKQNLLQVKNPQILHLATHGFYLKPEKEQGLTANPFFLEKERGTANIQIFEDTKPQTNIFFDPLTYCGLAFAGANNSSSEKSILLGTEIPSLSLWNTELVVLSACETGVGTTETVTSEGKIYKAEEVYSLRRAFEEAGARAVLSTMWPAHDDATQKFMTRFYELYLDKVPPQQALRAVQLEFLKDSQYSHPYYWANFVLVGTDKHFPEHTEKVKSPKEDSYMNIAMICLRIITIIIVIVFCLIKIIQLRRSDVAKARLARKQKRIKGRESK